MCHHGAPIRLRREIEEILWILAWHRDVAVRTADSDVRHWEGDRHLLILRAMTEEAIADPDLLRRDIEILGAQLDIGAPAEDQAASRELGDRVVGARHGRRRGERQGRSANEQRAKVSIPTVWQFGLPFGFDCVAARRGSSGRPDRRHLARRQYTLAFLPYLIRAGLGPRPSLSLLFRALVRPPRSFENARGPRCASQSLARLSGFAMKATNAKGGEHGRQRLGSQR